MPSCIRLASAESEPADTYVRTTTSADTGPSAPAKRGATAAHAAKLVEEGYRFRLDPGFGLTQPWVTPDKALKALEQAQERATVQLQAPDGSRCHIATTSELMRVGQVPFCEVDLVAPPGHRQGLTAVLQAIDEVEHPAFRRLSHPETAARTSAIYSLLSKSNFEKGCQTMHALIDAVKVNKSASSHPASNLLSLYRTLERFPEKQPLALAVATAFPIKQLPQIIEKFCQACDPHVEEVGLSLAADKELRQLTQIVSDSVFGDDPGLGERLGQADTLLELFEPNYRQHARPLLQALTASSIPFAEGVELATILGHSKVKITDKILEDAAHFKALEPLDPSRRVAVAQLLKAAFRTTSVMDRKKLVDTMVVAGADEQLWQLTQASELDGKVYSDVFARVAPWRQTLPQPLREKATELAVELLPNAPKMRRQELLDQLERLGAHEALWAKLDGASGREGVKRLQALSEIEAIDAGPGNLEITFHPDHMLVGDTHLLRS